MDFEIELLVVVDDVVFWATPLPLLYTLDGTFVNNDDDGGGDFGTRNKGAGAKDVPVDDDDVVDVLFVVVIVDGDERWRGRK
ncbi:hypothetical protein SAMD00019534_108900 [Acytostelium subglobosum LB1]|uniref:hypothetical protein n=1 Tax=Acytostelium subglobosum LB1 TaxID=1410327 RepID=UPI000644B238|nr:hypothetical protein SAMD00019534_108900 [Acytostelium subglobosum LB1]GAM27714.1 hypothetical protein SAMD00019534_108900 [Acytostelium subglobosum LB1]|eukprot:XP_012749373.1 hypothetical protein SAMD00019534_108900 [Acytostelium subglobosum LB1]